MSRPHPAGLISGLQAPASAHEGDENDFGLSWASFAAEIRCMVLQVVADDNRGNIAQFASVSKEWLDFFEARNFRRIKLRVPCLDDFQEMTKRNRHLVQHVWLHVELPSTDPCFSCNSQVDPHPEEKMATACVLKLLQSLSDWDKTGSLRLELSLESPDDKKHWFSALDFGGETEEWTSEEGGQPDPEYHTVSDSNHGWRHGRQIRGPPSLALRQLFSTIDFELPVELHRIVEVSIVTTFTIRRQTRRQLWGWEVLEICSCFPRLETLHLEPWRENDFSDNHLFKFIGICFLYSPHVAKTLTVFRDFNEDYETISQECPVEALLLSTREVNEVETQFADKYVYGIGSFQKLYLSFEIDARKFSSVIPEDWEWIALQTLVLTSQCLTSSEPASEVSLCLRQGAKAALKMPALQKMVLWNGKRGEACAFTYSRHEYCLRWRSTWRLEIDHDVVEAWDRVFQESGDSSLRVHQEEINSGDILSHGDAIYHLKLPEGVDDKVSLQQIRKDARPADWLKP